MLRDGERQAGSTLLARVRLDLPLCSLGGLLVAGDLAYNDSAKY
jgi:hypothetical protein